MSTVHLPVICLGKILAAGEKPPIERTCEVGTRRGIHIIETADHDLLNATGLGRPLSVCLGAGTILVPQHLVCHNAEKKRSYGVVRFSLPQFHRLVRVMILPTLPGERKRYRPGWVADNSVDLQPLHVTELGVYLGLSI